MTYFLQILPYLLVGFFVGLVGESREWPLYVTVLVAAASSVLLSLVLNL
jgi:hypothetical protein